MAGELLLRTGFVVTAWPHVGKVPATGYLHQLQHVAIRVAEQGDALAAVGVERCFEE
jgi:hypothetical protein